MDERSASRPDSGSLPASREQGNARAYRRGLEELIVSISSSFVTATCERLDQTIHEALAQVGEFIGPDRVYVFELSTDNTTFSCTNDWCRPGIPSIKSSLHRVSTALYSWSSSKILAGDDIRVVSRDAIPLEGTAERMAMDREGIRSFLTLPLRSSDGVVGGIRLDWIRGPADLSDDYLPLLRVVGQVIAIALVRAKSERQLAESEARHRTLMSQSPEGVVCFELAEPAPLTISRDEMFAKLMSARLIECNAVFAKHRGAKEPAQLRGKTLSELAWAPRARLVALCDELIAGGFHFDEVESTLTNAEGVEVAVRVRGHGVVENGMLKMLWGVIADISERKEQEAKRALLEEELQQARRLEAIGMLAGGIAHDFNNLLAVILSCSQLASRKVASNPEQAASYLGQVQEAGIRAAALTRQLLAFSRRQPMQRRWLDLGDLVRSLYTLLRRLIRTSVQLELDVPNEPIGVIGDPSQLEQVLINLCVNAGDAIPDVGSITIKVSRNEERSHSIRRGVVLEVIDTGTGIPEEIRGRVFDPFYTTKAPGKGTGVGLAVVKNIVDQHGGEVSLTTALNEGSTFRVRLPWARQPDTQDKRPEVDVARGGTETILLAEDDQLMREAVRDLLAGAGYTVIEAVNGAEAIRLFEENSERIDLVFVDVMMPKITGRAVYERLLLRWPNTRFLFSTGYVSGVVPENFFDDQKRPVLFKPYDSDALLRKVREVIDATVSR
ncbi:MAG: ATP-binding protein [Polyangiaceae bacterium]